MNKDINAWLGCWQRIRSRSDIFREKIELDPDSDQFEEVIVLLNHSIHECLSSQIILIENLKFEGLVPLSRKIFESYVQIKYLVKNPSSKRDYALFERLKVLDTHKYFMELNQSMIDDGEQPIATDDQAAYYKDRIKKRPDLICIFKGFGTEVGFFMDKNGKKKKWKSWYGNHGGFQNLEQLASNVRETRLYKLMYPTWSSSLHGQMVSIDYSLSVIDDKMITKSSEEFGNECWNLFTMSFGAGFMSYMAMLIHFDQPAFWTECEKIIHESEVLGMRETFEQYKFKIVDYYGIQETAA